MIFEQIFFSCVYSANLTKNDRDISIHLFNKENVIGDWIDQWFIYALSFNFVFNFIIMPLSGCLLS